MTIMLKPHSVETEFFLQNSVSGDPIDANTTFLETKVLPQNSDSLCALHRVLIRNQE